MLRRAWKPVAATVVVGTPAYLLYSYSTRQTFDLQYPVRGSDGKREMATKTLRLLSTSEAEARISANATAKTQARPNGLIWNYTNAFLPSNDPVEDAHSEAIVQRDDKTGDYALFAVMDGHGGYHTSRLLSDHLIFATVASISALISASEKTPTSGTLETLKSLISTGSKKIPTSLDANPSLVSLAIQSAFVGLDDELVKAPVQLLRQIWSEEARKTNVVPDFSSHPDALKMMLPALSGSCALLAVFDTAHRDLYVACTGDSRAVAGVWETTTDGKGAWKVDVLSDDQTARNPSELKRLREEHPGEEYVVQNGRILGSLEPSRAFGDARYKWPADIQAILNQAFLVGNGQPMRRIPPYLKTPPYVTARPVVTHRKLSSGSEGALRFLVLATDGLWDVLSSEEVVSLVGGHLAGLRGTVPKSDLFSLVPTSSGSATIQGKDHRRDPKGSLWTFVDDNISTHLLRNALGGGDDKEFRTIVSIPAPLSRRHRDDITVTVVWWQEGQEDGARITSFTEPAKPKL